MACAVVHGVAHAAQQLQQLPPSGEVAGHLLHLHVPAQVPAAMAAQVPVQVRQAGHHLRQALLVVVQVRVQAAVLVPAVPEGGLMLQAAAAVGVEC